MARPTSRCVACVIVVLLTSSVHVAALATPSQPDITHLLSYLEQSGCTFFRNGTWYESKEARAHLERKYEYLMERSLVDSAEDFIERAALSSSMSGEHYFVQCPGQVKVTSGDWLRAELAPFVSRMHQKENGSSSNHPFTHRATARRNLFLNSPPLQRSVNCRKLSRYTLLLHHRPGTILSPFPRMGHID